MNSLFIVNQIGKITVVEFRTASLMDPLELQTISESLYKLVDDEDRRQMILDFERVQYLSSQAIGIVLTINKKLSALPNSKLILVGVGPKLMELIRITRLDKVLIIKPTQDEAVKHLMGK